MALPGWTSGCNYKVCGLADWSGEEGAREGEGVGCIHTLVLIVGCRSASGKCFKKIKGNINCHNYLTCANK